MGNSISVEEALKWVTSKPSGASAEEAYNAITSLQKQNSESGKKDFFTSALDGAQKLFEDDPNIMSDLAASFEKKKD